MFFEDEGMSQNLQLPPWFCQVIHVPGSTSFVITQFWLIDWNVVLGEITFTSIIKLNAMWHFVCSCFIDIFPWLKRWLSNYMWHEMFIHVYFVLKLVVKRKELLSSTLPSEQRRLYSDLSKSVHNDIYCLNFLKKNYIIWKMTLFLIKSNNIYNCKLPIPLVHWLKQYFICTNAYQTKRLVLNIFSTNTCVLTPLVIMKI